MATRKCLCLSIFILEIFIVSLPARTADLQSIEADRHVLTLIFAGRHRVVEVTDTVGDVMLFLLFRSVQVITAIPKHRVGQVTREFGPVAQTPVTFWAFEVRPHRKNDSLRLV